MIWCMKTYIIAYVKTQKNKIHYPLCQTYSPTFIELNHRAWMSSRFTPQHHLVTVAMVAFTRAGITGIYKGFEEFNSIN